MLIFNGGVQLLELADGSIALSGPKAIRFEGLSKADREILFRLVDGLSDNDPSAESSIVQSLKQNGYVSQFDAGYDSNSRFSRQIDYLAAQSDKPVLVQSVVESKKVLIVGCGGTGSMIAQALLGHGLRNFILVDDDTVQNSNLNRQIFFSESDLGTSKVEALKGSILRLQSGAEVSCESTRVKSPGDFDRLVSTYAPDFIVCGADYPPIIIHKWATLTSLKYNVPVIFGGIGIESSSLGPLLDSATSKNNYIEWLDKKLSLIRPESLRPVRGSLASTNMAGSSLLAFEIFKFFTKSETCLSLGTRLLFDFKTYSVSKRECFNGKS